MELLLTNPHCSSSLLLTAPHCSSNMHRLVSLQMVSLGSLLLLGPPAVSSSRCLSPGEMNVTLSRFLRSYWERMRLPMREPDATTCAQVAADTRGDVSARSLSPWTYRLDRDESRCPPIIPLAVCLCHGCIVNGREDLSYNSVPVFSSLLVLRKSRCHRSPDRYRIHKEFLRVPVACTCAEPQYVT